MDIKIIYVLAAIVLLFGIGQLFIKTIDWYEKRRSLKIPDARSEFLSDLYKLQHKYALRGKMDYAASVGLIIDVYNAPDPEPQPATSYGKDALEKITNANYEIENDY